MPKVSMAPSTAVRLYEDASAAQWGVSQERFVLALQTSLQKAVQSGAASPGDVERYLRGLHLSDLALACACADGRSEAWDHFVREYRPILYRAAEAVAGSGESREIADSIYAELFGLPSEDRERRSLFLYFHGRSSLATWLRAVLAQRHVDAIRRRRRLEPIEDDETVVDAPAPLDPERGRWLSVMTEVLGQALEALASRDRLRLDCYYRQSLTLAQVGVLLGEHEATVSRQLARTRRAIRQHVERELRDTHGLTEAATDQCFQSVIDDAGTIDLGDLLSGQRRKESVLERSQ